MLKLLAYHLYYPREYAKTFSIPNSIVRRWEKTPKLEIWSYCSAGKTTITLSVSTKTQQKTLTSLGKSRRTQSRMEGEKQQGEDPPPHPRKRLSAG